MLENLLLLATFCTSMLLLFIVGQESQDRYFKKVFFGYIITSSLWSLLLSVMLLFPAQATLLGKVRMTFICWTPYFLILSIHQLFHKPLTKTQAYYYAAIPTIISCLILFTPLIVQSYTLQDHDFIINKGAFAYLFFVYHLLAIAYQVALVTIEQFSLGTANQKILVRVIFYSVVLSYCLGVFLAIILPLFFKKDFFINLSPLASVLMGLGISYSVWRYQVFKIRLLLRESFILTASMAFFSLCIAGVLFILGINMFHDHNLVPWTMLGAIFLAQIFNAQVRNLLYHVFNKDKLAFEDALRYLYRSFGSVLERNAFHKKISALVIKIFKPLDQELNIFLEPRQNTPYLSPTVYYEDDPLYPRTETQLNHDLAISLVFDQKLLGFLFLTLNKTYLNYTLENIELLQIFARQVSIALANTFSYEELQQQQQRMFQNEKIALLGQLTAGIVHELRNPLTAITMTVSNMKQCLDETNYDKKIIERLWRSGQNSIQEMKQFLENMRTFSREDHCLMEPIELRNIVEEIVPLLRKKASEHHVQFIQQVPTNLKLTCNAQRIKQVLLNLLLNGIEAMPTGGKLSLTGQAKEQQVIIKVADTGSGIPEVLRNKIFTPFYTTKKEGTGLGLSIVKEIVEAHRGSISIASNAGQGTTFTLNLPQS